jgi:hypothetical protein
MFGGFSKGAPVPRFSGYIRFGKGPIAHLHRFLRDRRGNVSIIVAIMIVPLIGMLAVAGEVSSWYTVNRNLQNAADSAAIAAARNADDTNDSGGVPHYQREANAVAAQYGFVSGTNNVTVTPTTVTCPSGNGACFQVDISRVLPVMLSGIVGFTGSTTLNGSHAQMISARAIATPAGGGTSFCLLALGGTVSTGIQANGTPFANMSGCGVGSNGDVNCNGNNGLGSDSVYAVYNADSGCTASGSAGSAHSNYPDPPGFTDSADAARGSNLPSNNCGGTYQQEDKHGNGLTGANVASGTPSWSGTTEQICGDMQLSGDLNLGANTVLIIRNGTLDMNGHTLTGNSGTTIIFTGPTVGGLTPSYYPTGTGTLNISSPSTGPWAGVAIWQDPSLPPQTIKNAGSSPTWNIEGMVYLPVSNVTIDGAINKDGTGACFGLVVNTVSISGTGYIVDHGCGGSGTTLPGVAATIVALVQ